MSADTSVQETRRNPSGLLPSRWSLLQQRRWFIGYCLAVEVAAVLLTLSAVRTLSAHDWRLFVALAVVGVLQAEISRQVERARRRISETPHINMTSVWTFAAVLVLPPVLIAALVVVLYAHSAARVWYRLRRVQPFRVLFNTSLVVVTCLLARLAVEAVAPQGLVLAESRTWTDVGALAIGAVVYFFAGAFTVLPGLKPRALTFDELFGSLTDNALEIATLCLGAVTAVVLLVLPELSLAMVPTMLLLQRSMLVTQLEVEATTDNKTGVLNTAGWHHLAEREVARAARAGAASLAILMIDLDYFKSINDRFGHLVGDQVLKSVASTIADEVRDRDAVGRFGGEEFIVLLPATAENAARAVAERIRLGVGTLACWSGAPGQSDQIEGLSVSIGIAMYPGTAADIDELVHEADVALYQAKKDGRNRVAMSATG